MNYKKVQVRYKDEIRFPGSFRTKSGSSFGFEDTLINGTGKRLVWGSNHIGTGVRKRDGGEGGKKKGLDEGYSI